MYCRISEAQVSCPEQKEQPGICWLINREIVEYLIEQNRRDYPELIYLHNDFCSLYTKKMISQKDIFSFFYALFSKNKITLKCD